MSNFISLTILAVIPFLSVASASPVQILCFGDSITEGNMLPKADKARVWTQRVEDDSNGKWHLINEGKGGRPTDSVAEFRAALQRHLSENIDVLVIALGMNDSRDV